MYLSSEDRYIGSVKHFRIQTNTLPLNGQWAVSLAELHVDNAISKETVIYTNIIQDSIIGTEINPILRRVHEGKQFIFHPEQFHPLCTENINDIRFEFISEEIPFERAYITLHFKQYE